MTLSTCAEGALAGSQVGIEPELHTIEKVKSSPIDEGISARLVFGSKEDGSGEDSLKALDDPAIVIAVWWEPEEIEHLGGAFELNDAAPLSKGESSQPNRDEPILAKR